MGSLSWRGFVSEDGTLLRNTRFARNEPHRKDHHDRIAESLLMLAIRLRRMA